MTVTVKHSKTNSITDWTQAQLDEQIALGNFPAGTTLANIVLPSDWNNDHTLTGVGTMAEQNANSVAITGGTINNTTIGATTASTGKFTSVTTPSVTATSTDLTLSAISTGNINLNTPNGTAFRVLPVTSASSNWLQVGNPSTTVIRLGPAGTTVADFRILAPTFTSFHTGSSADGLSDGNQQFRVSHTASAVNYVQITGASTTNAPSITAQGSDSASALILSSKGAGNISFWSSGSTYRQLVIAGANSSVNYHQFAGSSANNAIQYSAQGSDTNISMALQPKGTGAIDLAAGSSGVNISNGGTVTAVARSSSGSGYTAIPTVTISAPTTAGGVQATLSTITMAAQSGTAVTPAAGGTGYTLNDTLTVVGGTFSQAAQFTVTGVSGGVVTQVTRSNTNYGQYTVLPSSPAATTGGTGTGCTLNMLWEYLSATISNAGSGYIEQPTITFTGTNTTLAAAYATIGSGTVVRSLGSTLSFYTPTGEGFRVYDSAGNTTNYWAAAGAITANTPFLFATGTDTNVSGRMTSKGIGSLTFMTNGGSQIQFNVSHTASAVNYVQVTGNVTTSPPIISAQGSDATVAMLYRTKGNGVNHSFQNGSGNNGLVVTPVNSTANYLQVSSSVTTAAPSIASAGTDTNIDLALTPKGTGVVRFGTYTANMALTVQGYIEIKDSGGTLRKLAVIA